VSEAPNCQVGWLTCAIFGERPRTEIGVSPKTAARILRFEHACKLINRERPSLAHVAAACGFHDQPHMTREWNLLAGCTPRAWISQELPFFQDFDSWVGDDTT
jgi:AraC-like DNA-binding protein